MSDQTKDAQGQDGSRSGTDASSQKAERDVGHALRSVYTAAVNEDIPAELLDLLGKLD